MYTLPDQQRMALVFTLLRKGTFTVAKWLRHLVMKLAVGILKGLKIVRNSSFVRELPAYISATFAFLKRLVTSGRIWSFVSGLLGNFRVAETSLSASRSTLETSLLGGLVRVSTQLKVGLPAAVAQAQAGIQSLRESLSSARTLPLPSSSAHPVQELEQVVESESYPEVESSAALSSPSFAGTASQAWEKGGAADVDVHSSISFTMGSQGQAVEEVLGEVVESSLIESRDSLQAEPEAQAEVQEAPRPIFRADTLDLEQSQGAQEEEEESEAEEEDKENEGPATPASVGENAPCGYRTPVATDVRYGGPGQRRLNLGGDAGELPSVDCKPRAVAFTAATPPLPAAPAPSPADLSCGSFLLSNVSAPLSLSLFSNANRSHPSDDSEVSSVVMDSPRSQASGSSGEGRAGGEPPAALSTPLALAKAEAISAPPPTPLAMGPVDLDAPLVPQAVAPAPAPPAQPSICAALQRLSSSQSGSLSARRSQAAEEGTPRSPLPPSELVALAASLRESLGRQSLQMRASSAALRELRASQARQSREGAQTPSGASASIVESLSRLNPTRGAASPDRRAAAVDSSIDRALRPLASVEGLRQSASSLVAALGGAGATPRSPHPLSLSQSIDRSEALSGQEAIVQNISKTLPSPSPNKAPKAAAPWNRTVSPLGKVLQDRAARQLQRQIVEAFAHVPHGAGSYYGHTAVPPLSPLTAGPGSPGGENAAPHAAQGTAHSPMLVAHLSPYHCPPSTGCSGSGHAQHPLSPLRQPKFALDGPEPLQLQPRAPLSPVSPNMRSPRFVR